MKITIPIPPPLIPPGVYLVQLEEVRLVDGCYGPHYFWRLRIMEGEHAGKELRAWSKVSASVTSKTAYWVSVFSRKPYQPDAPIDWDTLVGKTARAVVWEKQTRDGWVFPKVGDLLPAPDSEEVL